MAETHTFARDSADPGWPRDLEARLGRVGSASLDVAVVLGRARMTLEELLNVEPGALIETDRASGMPVDVLVNGRPFCRGEVVVVGDHLAVRISHFTRPS